MNLEEKEHSSANAVTGGAQNLGSEMQRACYQYYLDNYDKLVKIYDGKVLLLTEGRVADACDDEAQAYASGLSKYGLGNFIFQRCSSQQKTYSTILHTRTRL